MRKSKLRDTTKSGKSQKIQIARWNKKLSKEKKSKLQDGMKNDGKYPNCEIEPKLAKIKKIQIGRWNGK